MAGAVCVIGGCFGTVVAWDIVGWCGGATDGAGWPDCCWKPLDWKAAKSPKSSSFVVAEGDANGLWKAPGAVDDCWPTDVETCMERECALCMGCWAIWCWNVGIIKVWKGFAYKARTRTWLAATGAAGTCRCCASFELPRIEWMAESTSILRPDAEENSFKRRWVS